MRKILLALLLGSAVIQVFAIERVEVRPLVERPLLSTSDFSGASVSGAGENSVLNLNLTAKAAARLKTFTAHNLGAELPFLVDGKIIKSPVIRSVIEGQGFEVNPLNHDLAEAIANRINQHK
jgi:preprotein translocase subunit SecD